MIFRETTIPKSAAQLKDILGMAILNCATRKFPGTMADSNPFFDFDGIFYSIQRGIENLRRRFGDAKADQLIEMLAQAKAHHEEGWRLTGGKPPPVDRPKWWESKNASTELPGWWQRRLGNALLQDMQMVIMGRQPWAYPKELYRWGVDASLPELSEADLLDKSNEGD
jgi:hypothetical protein